MRFFSIFFFLAVAISYMCVLDLLVNWNISTLSLSVSHNEINTVRRVKDGTIWDTSTVRRVYDGTESLDVGLTETRALYGESKNSNLWISTVREEHLYYFLLTRRASLLFLALDTPAPTGQKVENVPSNSNSGNNFLKVLDALNLGTPFEKSSPICKWGCAISAWCSLASSGDAPSLRDAPYQLED